MENAALGLLRRVGGAALVMEMIELFLTDAPSRLERLRGALAAGDAGGVAAAAHSFRSSCGNLGAEGARESCERIELAAAQGRMEAVPDLVAELEGALLRESAELRRVLESAATVA